MATRVIRRGNTVTGQTTHATPGTTTTHAHGLTRTDGEPMVPVGLSIVETGPDLVEFVSADETNITVKSAGISAPFQFSVWY